MTPLPIWTNPDEDRYMANVGAEWKTPGKLASYTDPGFVTGFPDSYRICDHNGGDFGFRAPPSFVLNGNWRTVLTRRISDVIERVDKVLDKDNYDPCPPFPLTRLRIHAAKQDRPWLGTTFIAKFNPAFLKAMGWPRPAGRAHPAIEDCSLHLRIYLPKNGWAVISPGDVCHAGTTAHFCAVPRDEAITWANTFLKTALE